MDRIIVLDFGGQYCHLISRRIRDLGVYCEVLPYKTTKEELIKRGDLKGLILSGGAASVYDSGAPICDKNILQIRVPILGICYGHQLIAYLSKGNVVPGEYGEYGTTSLKIEAGSKLLEGLNSNEKVWMNHRDIVKELPEDYLVTASTKSAPIAAFQYKGTYGVQFHPEVNHTPKGKKILKNFVFDICQAKKQWGSSGVIKTISTEIKNTIGNQKALIALSGGIDSSTAAVLVDKVIGKNLIAVYVNTGLMRFREKEFIERTFQNLNLRIIDAQKRFFKALEGVTEPEEKRKIIGRLFVKIFEEVAEKEKAKILVQGTIYSDRIESGITQHSSKIKSHHNVGGLPENINLEIYEPLRELYKDEVRRIAKQLDLPMAIIGRHVFPGPGMAVRVIGEITPEKVEVVRHASNIIEEELIGVGLYKKVWMAFAVLLPIKSVGIQGDARSYKYPIVVRVIESKDAMTANFAKIPYKVLEKISTRITNEISAVNRVVYDISNKPPSTMEWE